jgi:hypothetical protein
MNLSGEQSKALLIIMVMVNLCEKMANQFLAFKTQHDISTNRFICGPNVRFSLRAWAGFNRS